DPTAFSIGYATGKPPPNARSTTAAAANAKIGCAALRGRAEAGTTVEMTKAEVTTDRMTATPEGAPAILKTTAAIMTTGTMTPTILRTTTSRRSRYSKLRRRATATLVTMIWDLSRSCRGR